MLNTNPFKNSFGLDISDLVLRVVQLKKKGKEIYLTSLNEQLVPPGYITEGEIMSPKRVIDFIQNLVKTAKGDKIKSPYVIAAIPERKTFIKLIQMPKIERNKMAEAIKWEALQHIPLAIDEIYLDWQIIPGDGARNNKMNVLIAAAPRTLIDTYTQVLENAGLIPIALELESLAIARSIIKEGESPKDYSELIIDLGGSRTNFIVFDLNTVQFTSSIPFSGTGLTQIISEKLKFKISDAEKAKIICGLDPKKGKGIIRKSLLPSIEELIIKTKEVINFYKDHFANAKDCRKIILSGGGAQLKNLELEINRALNIPVEKANPQVSIKLGSKVKFMPREKYPSFTTAIGLALRGVTKNDNA
jgi:type IV pilus assembly protein PilM